MIYEKHLTNPELHDPDNFIYIVHGLFDWDYGNPFDIKMPMLRENVKRALEKFQDFDDVYSASLVGRLTAQKAKEKFGWCGGDISHTCSFGSMGLIIEPQDAYVCVAWNCDVGTPHDKEQRKEWILKNQGKQKDCFSLLRDVVAVQGANYNEMVIRGNPETQIKGFFYKPESKKKEEEARTLAKITMDVLQKEIPIVVLPREVLPSRNYEDIKDTEQRELKKLCDHLAESSALSQAHMEFALFFENQRRKWERQDRMRNHYQTILGIDYFDYGKGLKN